MYEADRENRKRCAWRHPFYTSEYIKGAMWAWEKHTVGEAALCASGCSHACVPAVAGYVYKKAFKWIVPKLWRVDGPACLKLADIKVACIQYTFREVCGRVP
jgi:hypothetical protein